jgi:MauM/NapG family ferredoxin protein
VKSKDRERAVTRRSALVGLAVLGGGILGLRGKSHAAKLRPPGAATDGAFERKCIRCLRCVAVCPVKAIRFDSSLDLLGTDTPYIDSRERGCILCMKCTEACPSGALEPLDADREIVHAQVRMGRPELDKDRCIAWKGSGECRACYYACPYPDSAIRLEGMLLAPVFDEDACVGCGLCDEACPERARAITIRPEGT